MVSFLVPFFLMLFSSCITHHSVLKMPPSFITPSQHFVSKAMLKQAGANFFNEEENFDRLFAAKNMGISWIRLSPSKWKSALNPHEQGTFLLGRPDEYRGLIEEDIKTLIKVLDWAHSLDLKVMLTFLTVPGRVFAQHNKGVQDHRIWQSENYQEQALQFFYDVALHVGDHPALIALNPINEPSPEKAPIQFSDWYKGDYKAWAQTIHNSPQDLNRFYERTIEQIRKVRKHLPIVLDAGFHAHPWAFKILKPHKDPFVWYSFHWYEPFLYSQKKTTYSYPGKVPTGENPLKSDTLHWDKNTLLTFLKPVVDWQQKHKIESDKIIVGEFGVNRLMKGASDYLRDCRAMFIEHGFMHAFYQFREAHFPRMDYELGSKEKIGPYWLALDAHVSPNYERLRTPEFLEALGLHVRTLKKPLRGFSSWNSFGTSIDEKTIKEIMQAMKEKGLLEKGFDTIIIDGGWRSEHLSPSGLLRGNQKFPDITSLAAYAHQEGFKLGLHIPIGTKDCGNKTEGTFGHEKVNAEQLRKWNIDLVKLDQCLLDGSEEWPAELLQSTYKSWAEHGKTIERMASASHYWPWYPRYADYGRTTLDIRPKIFGGARFDEPFLGDFLTVTQAARQNNAAFTKATSVYTNDPDMLVIENGMSFKEDRSHLAMWAMMGAPLILGNDPRSMSDDILKLLKNEHLLTIQSDPTEQGRLIIDATDVMVWRKRLKDGTTALLVLSLKKNGLLNRTFSFRELDCAPLLIRSVFGDFKGSQKQGLSFSLEPHDCELLLLGS